MGEDRRALLRALVHQSWQGEYDGWEKLFGFLVSIQPGETALVAPDPVWSLLGFVLG